MKRTIAALIARGLDSAKAQKLAHDGWTVQKLKLAQPHDLRAVGLSDAEIELVHEGGRPPIEGATLVRLLFKNRYQCCVCRDASKGFIVHHIVEWSTSRSHDISNLAVLCLDHHGKAHTTGSLNQNLDPATLRGLKEEWEAEVGRLDAQSISTSLRGAYAHWAFINEMRLLELAHEHGISLASLRYYERALADGVVDARGIPLPVRTDTFYKYEGANIITRYGFMKDVFDAVLEQIAVHNISDYLDRDVVFPAVCAGDFVFVYGAHTFSPLTKVEKGIGQDCRGTRRANKVEVRFTFDRWAASSSSSFNDWLVGTKRAGSLLLVRDVFREDGRVVLTGTALGVASHVDGLKTRDYAGKLVITDADFDDDWEDDDSPAGEVVLD